MDPKARFLVALLAGIAGAVAPAPAPAAERDYRHATNTAGDLRFTARYLNLDGDLLSIAFTLPQRALRESAREFGYSPDETRRMAKRCRCTQSEYDRRVEAYYRSRLLKWDKTSGRRILRVDVPAVVKRNALRLSPLAREFERLAAARGDGRDATIDTVVTFVQSGLDYRLLPSREGGREILGFYDPLRALQAGAGDCDSKAALLAAILMNIRGTRMIGVDVGRHYLVGIARKPRRGDASIQYRGQSFVLIEPSGPARLPPGTIHRRTQAALDATKQVRIDPLF
ncbi:MAG TPA: hypothetical protein VM240_04155 [Verrucomicrobiae bacterium]|nr:hypothetical protein [Verrucomicrobiae bacterium]